MAKHVMSHWIRAKRSKKMRCELYTQLRKVDACRGSARRMRDWTFGHIFLFMQSHAQAPEPFEYCFVERIREIIQ